MPEGDTIFRTAVRLQQVLQGQSLRKVEAGPGQLPTGRLVNRVVRQVESRGKHLLMHLDDGSVIHSHMGMTGSWHVYRHGQRWQKPRRNARLTLDCGQYQVVCFTPKLLEVLDAGGLRRNAYLQRLGPDLLADPLRLDEMLPRFRLHDGTVIGEAIMNQTIVCGIGNVYKSEVLFLCRVDPFLPVRDLGDAQLEDLLRTAAQVMRRNVDGHPRRTRFRAGSGRYWVYGRSGQSCFQCGVTVQLRRQGDLGRTTYWCPSCQ